MAIIDRLSSAWQRFWFPEIPLRRFGIFRLIITAFCLVDVSVISADNGRVAQTSDLFYRPIILMRPFDLRFEEPWTTALRLVLIVSLGLALMGLITRPALMVAAPLYAWWTALPMAFGNPSHGRIPIVFSLVVLAIGPGGKTYSVTDKAHSGERDREHDPIAGWGLRVVQVLIVGAYLFAVYAKFVHAGWSWLEGRTIAATLLRPEATSLSDLVIGHSFLIRAGAVSLLLFELLAPLAFVRGWPRNVWVIVGIFFHVMTYAFLGIDFLPWIVAYAVFFDLEVAVDRIRPALRSRLRYA